MTVARGIYLAGFFSAMAIVVIGLRAEQVRVTTRIEQLQRERVVLRRTSWALQVEISRLRTPRRIIDRVAHWSLDVQRPRPPGERSANAYAWVDR